MKSLFPDMDKEISDLELLIARTERPALPKL